MANISHFTQTVNGVSTTYDIHDANAIPRSGGAVMTEGFLGRTDSTGSLNICGGNSYDNSSFIALRANDPNSPSEKGAVIICANNGSISQRMNIFPNGILMWGSKYIAMQEDTIPRSGGAVISGTRFSRTVDNSELVFSGGTNWENSASFALHGKDFNDNPGAVWLQPRNDIIFKTMLLLPDGTWTWQGTACQILSDQRYKQQIDAIDDKLLDAWEDVNLVQFKYNDAVETKGDKARLHTGYVVQQIDNACKSHGVDISAYGLYCHEQYPEETEEVEVTQKDGTKTKERKVIREANEHYSLRYTEALIVECKYLRRCIARLTARIEELEKGKEAEK